MRGFYDTLWDSNVQPGLRAARWEDPSLGWWKELVSLPWEEGTLWAPNGFLPGSRLSLFIRQFIHFWGKDSSAFSHTSCSMEDTVRGSAFRNRLCYTVTEEGRWDMRPERQSGKPEVPSLNWKHQYELRLDFTLQNRGCFLALCPLKTLGIMTSSVAVSSASTQIRVSTYHF